MASHVQIHCELPQKCLQAHPTQLIALEPMMSMINLNHVLGDQRYGDSLTKIW